MTEVVPNTTPTRLVNSTGRQWDWGHLGGFRFIYSNIYDTSTVCQQLERQIPETTYAHNKIYYQSNLKNQISENSLS